MKKILVLAVLSFFFLPKSQAQPFAEMMESGKHNFFEIQDAFYEYWGNKPYERGKGYKQFKRWEYFMERRSYPSGKLPNPNLAYLEHEKIQKKYKNLSAAQLSSAGQWEPLGPSDWNSVSYNPGNGRVNVIVRAPDDPNTLFVGVPSGGLWKSNDAGTTWNPLTDHLPVLGVSGIAINPLDPDQMFIATGDGDGSDTYSIGVLKSSDGGLTWNNTGLSWNEQLGRSTRKIMFHPTDTSTLFLASSIGLYKTTDGGVNWNIVQSGSFRDIEFHPTDPSIVYACTNRYYKSTDGGDNFLSFNSSIGIHGPSFCNRMSLAVSPDQPNWVYVLAGKESDSSFRAVYRSTNSGDNFTIQADSPNIFSYSEDGSGSGGQSWYDMALACNPTNANEIYVGGINVWKSSDAGVNYTITSHWVYPANVGYTHADIHALEYFGNTLYCGSDGGIFESTDGAQNWIDLSFGLEIMQFYRMGGAQSFPNRILAGAQDNGCNLWEDSTWLHVFGADGMECIHHPTNPDILYSSSQNGGIRKSTNGGQSFSGITGGISGNGGWVTPYVMDYSNPEVLYAGFQDVWKSSNGGNSWSQISNFNISGSLDVLEVSPSDSDVIYAGFGSVLWRTTDGGANWSNISGGIPSIHITYMTIDPNNPDKIWVSLSGTNPNYKVYRSADGGATWENYTSGLPNLSTNCITLEWGSADALYLGTDVGIYYRDSTMANWFPFYQGLPNVIVNELEINYTEGKIRAATYGRGLWESALFGGSAIPPVAQFVGGDFVICPGDSVQLFDNSLFNSPDWQWYVDGVIQDTSYERNPVFYFAQEGVYEVTLVVNNANGYDTLNQTINIDFGDNMLEVSIVLDNYGSETNWQILDQSGVVVAQGGGYDNDLADSLVLAVQCLQDGCYSFLITDSYGDGICCGFGNGSYTLTNQLGDVLASGGDFEFSESTDFCVAVGVVFFNTLLTDANCGVDDGAISIEAVGGNSIYEYSIDSGMTFQTSPDFLGLVPGDYEIMVMDSSGVSGVGVVTIGEANEPNAAAASNIDLIYLDQSGEVEFTNGGTQYEAYIEWDFGDGTTSGQYDYTHTYTTPGVYMVSMVAYSGNCTDTAFLSIVVEQSVNTSQIYLENIIQVVPNPVTDKFNLIVNLVETKDANLMIFDNTGKQIFERQLKGLNNYSEMIPFDKYPKGLYFVVLEVEGKKYTEKIVKP